MCKYSWNVHTITLTHVYLVCMTKRSSRNGSAGARPGTGKRQACTTATFSGAYVCKNATGCKRNECRKVQCIDCFVNLGGANDASRHVAQKMSDKNNHSKVPFIQGTCLHDRENGWQHFDNPVYWKKSHRTQSKKDQLLEMNCMSCGICILQE